MSEPGECGECALLVPALGGCGQPGLRSSRSTGWRTSNLGSCKPPQEELHSQHLSQETKQNTLMSEAELFLEMVSGWSFSLR